MELIVDFLESIDRKIINEKNISTKDLKKFLLIIYHELIKEKNDPIIKSLIIIILKHLIDLENNTLNAKQHENALFNLISYYISDTNQLIFNDLFKNIK